ncbi:hypothetical protein LDK41_07240, partial [Lactiplantibacillus plantarum]|nr:hypothetical protein [Lactiplantibacillus plantarum]
MDLKHTPSSSNTNLDEFGYQQELKRTLSVKDLVIYGLIFMVPIAPMGIYGAVISVSQGGLCQPVLMKLYLESNSFTNWVLFFDFDFELNLNSINKVLPVL